MAGLTLALTRGATKMSHKYFSKKLHLCRLKQSICWNEFFSHTWNPQANCKVLYYLTRAIIQRVVACIKQKEKLYFSVFIAGRRYYIMVNATVRPTHLYYNYQDSDKGRVELKQKVSSCLSWNIIKVHELGKISLCIKYMLNSYVYRQRTLRTKLSPKKKSPMPENFTSLFFICKMNCRVCA